MGEWIEAKLGDILELKRGYDLPQQKRVAGSVPVISSSGPTGWHNEAMAKPPGVVTGRYGTLGQVFFVETDYWPLNTTLYVKDFKGNDPRFISYLLKTMDFFAYSDKAAVPGLNRNHLHLAPVRLPALLSEQQAIASVLSALDAKIRSNSEISQTLASMAQAIFKDWFVDFGPTRAKQEGREPYFAPEVWSLFPAQLDDTGKPEGWISSTIGQEVDVVGGSTPSTKDPVFWGGDIAWATPKDLAALATPVLLRTERRLTKAGLSQISSGLLPAGTVLLSSRAPIGYLAVAQIPTAINQGFIAMICQKRLSNIFVWLWTQANMVTVLQNANGSTFQEISKANFRPILVTVATPDVLQAFNDTVGTLFDRIIANEKENCSLIMTRDFLLSKLLSGDARIADATSLI